MARENGNPQTVQHPSSHRGRVNLGLLAFAVMGAPILWVMQFTVGETLTGSVCFAGTVPNSGTPQPWLQSALIAIDAVAIAVALLAGLISFRIWRISREEEEGPGAHAMEVGEGRTRFLALWGMMMSAGFLAAIIFATFASTMVPLCG